MATRRERIVQWIRDHLPRDYEFAVGEKHKHTSVISPDNAHASELEKSVQYCASKLNETGTLGIISGGIGLALNCRTLIKKGILVESGEFSIPHAIQPNGYFRRHNALHLAVFDYDLDKIVSSFAGDGFVLASRKTMLSTKESKADIYKRITPEKIGETDPKTGSYLYKNIRLVHLSLLGKGVMSPEEESKIPQFVRYVDLYVHHIDYYPDTDKAREILRCKYDPYTARFHTVSSQIEIPQAEEGNIRVTSHEWDGITIPWGLYKPEILISGKGPIGIVNPAYLYMVKFFHMHPKYKKSGISASRRELEEIPPERADPVDFSDMLILDHLAKNVLNFYQNLPPPVNNPTM